MWTSLVAGMTLAASVLSGSAAHAAAPNATAPNLSGVGSLIDQTVTSQLSKDKIPGAAVVVVAGGQTVFAQGYGVSDVAAETPVDPALTEFFTGSVAKVFTATARSSSRRAGSTRTRT